MKIGDKVRFLNEVGGGVITAIKDKGIVLVSDEDGFEIPTLAKDVVVVETDDYNIAKTRTNSADKFGRKKETAEDKPRPTSIKQALSVKDDGESEAEADVTEKEVTYRPMSQVRRGAEKLNILLAFVPTDAKRLSESGVEVYLVNDCNYDLRFSLLSRGDDDTVSQMHEGELAANTKIFLEETARADLQKWESVALQAFAYKHAAAFRPKPAINVAVRLDGTKFYKLHAFTESVFFNTPALQVYFVKDDRAAGSPSVDPAALKERMKEGQAKPAPAAPARQKARAAATTTRKEDGTWVTDLHAGELLDTFAGLDPADILQYQLKVFRETLEAHLGEPGARLIFIHGKGDGVLRNAVLRELSKRYRQCRWQDASFREYGYGATLVIVPEGDE